MPIGSPNQPYYTLLTGATGLLGRYLVKDLLMAGVRLAIVCRDSRRLSAEQRLEQLCAEWEQRLGTLLPRPVCLVGDIRFENLGLGQSARNWVAENCRACIHNAAILEFKDAPRDQEPWVTNLQGTINVTDFCLQNKLDDFHHVSTAYICGNRTGTIREDELDCGQEFRNDYERSKFLAESHVRSVKGFRSTTIYRPAVITADSTNGYTTTYHGLHLYLRLMSMLVPQVEPDKNGIRQTHIRLPMTGNEQRNVVTVDWVSAVMTRLMTTPEAHGKTFHLAPDIKLTPRKLIDACYRYFGSAGVEFCGSENGDQPDLGEFERTFLTNVGIYNSYDRCDPVFDDSNAKEFIGDLPCPEIDEAVIHKFLRFGERDKWGKRRPRVVHPACTVSRMSDLLKEYAEAHINTEQMNRQAVLGFDIIGSGGGQWHYDGARAELLPGLPTIASASVIRCTAPELEQLLKRPGQNNCHGIPAASVDARLLTDSVDADTQI